MIVSLYLVYNSPVEIGLAIGALLFNSTLLLFPRVWKIIYEDSALKRGTDFALISVVTLTSSVCQIILTYSLIYKIIGVVDTAINANNPTSISHEPSVC